MNKEEKEKVREGGAGAAGAEAQTEVSRVNSDGAAGVYRRALFVFVAPTSFISSEQPPSAERLRDRNQSESNRPYSPAEAPPIDTGTRGEKHGVNLKINGMKKITQKRAAARQETRQSFKMKRRV